MLNTCKSNVVFGELGKEAPSESLSRRRSGAQLTRETLRLGSTVARPKLKGIDGGLHKRWSMWFNSIQRAKPYQPLTYEPTCP